MLGTMYSHQSLPKAYGASYSKGKSSGGVVTQVALVVLLLVAGSMSLMHMSSRSQVRDLKIHHEALQEELTYTKNHLHHVEAQLANKEAEYSHLAQEVHQYSAHHSVQELETLRTQKRVSDQNLATTQEEVKKLKEELDAAHALIDAYKHHLSDEVASHHQREETWLAVQQEWEKLEKELSAEVESLRAQLQTAHVKVPDAQHHEHTHPQHVLPEVQKHDALLDNLPPPHTQTQQHTTQHIHTGTPVPAAVPTPTPTHTATPVPAPAPQAAPVPAPAQHQQQQQQQQHHAPAPAPVPVHTTSPPHPAEAPHVHHDDHYQHTDASTATHDAGHHEQWQPTEYDQVWDSHNLYADYPGFVDEHQQQHDEHAGHHDAHTGHHDAHAGHHDAHAGHHDVHGSHAAHTDHGHVAATQQHTQQQHTQQHQEVPLPAGSPPQQHHTAGTTQQQHHTTHQQQQQHTQHTQQHGHQDVHHTQQQQQQQHDPHAAHHVVDDLAMKLGLGGHYEDHQQPQHH